MLGESLPAVGKLLDSRVEMTAPYVNLGLDTLRISDSIAANILPRYVPTRAR